MDRVQFVDGALLKMAFIYILVELPNLDQVQQGCLREVDYHILAVAVSVHTYYRCDRSQKPMHRQFCNDAAADRGCASTQMKDRKGARSS